MRGKLVFQDISPERLSRPHADISGVEECTSIGTPPGNQDIADAGELRSDVNRGNKKLLPQLDELLAPAEPGSSDVGEGRESTGKMKPG
jgi:hypothetical protein